MDDDYSVELLQIRFTLYLQSIFQPTQKSLWNVDIGILTSLIDFSKQSLRRLKNPTQIIARLRKLVKLYLLGL